MVFLRVAVVVALAVASACSPTGPVADTILVNGKIFTSNPAALWAQAIAIRGDRIVAVADTSAIEALADTATRRIDLAGRTVVPGFIDAHVHAGPQSPMHDVRVPDEPTSQQVAEALKSARSSAPKDLPLRVQVGGRVFDDTAVSRSWLDALVPDRPVVLQAWTGHGVILNSAALSAFGYDETIRDPDARMDVTRPDA